MSLFPLKEQKYLPFSSLLTLLHQPEAGKQYTILKNYLRTLLATRSVTSTVMCTASWRSLIIRSLDMQLKENEQQVLIASIWFGFFSLGVLGCVTELFLEKNRIV